MSLKMELLAVAVFFACTALGGWFIYRAIDIFFNPIPMLPGAEILLGAIGMVIVLIGIEPIKMGRSKSRIG